MAYLIQRRAGQKPAIFVYSESLARRKDMAPISDPEAKMFLDKIKKNEIDPDPADRVDDTVRDVSHDGIEVIDAAKVKKPSQKVGVVMDEDLTDEEIELALNPDIAAVVFEKKDRERKFDKKDKGKTVEAATEDSPSDEASTKVESKMKSEIAMVNALNLKNQLELYALNTVGVEIKQTTVKQMRKEIIEAIKKKHAR